MLGSAGKCVGVSEDLDFDFGVMGGKRRTIEIMEKRMVADR